MWKERVYRLPMIRKHFLSPCLGMFVLLAALSPALAQSPVPSPDQRGSFSVLIENDALNGTDSHYTNGLKLSWVSAENDLPEFGHWLAKNLPLLSKRGRKRIGYALGQNMYTPSNISIDTLQSDDRPYAGWLYGEVGIVSETGSRLDNATLSFGVVGPMSQAKNTQQVWHKLFDLNRPRGWAHQLDNEPTLNLTVERKWRNIWPHSSYLFGLDGDVTPHVGAALGNVFTHGAGGITLRIGQNLRNDFGPPRIRPSQPGSSHFTPWDDFGWYLFGGLEGRLVLRNMFLDGNTFSDSQSVDKKMMVGDAQLGVALVFSRFRLAFTQVFRSIEYEGQANADRFTAVSLTARF